MIEDLIYDVGMHRGADTEFYLAKGFRVVAVEANPTLVEDVRARLADKIESGGLKILDCAISDYASRADFWINTRDDLWSSLDADESFAWAGCERVEVECRPLSAILEEHGVPYYLKIDIEGADVHCVQALRHCSTKPRYVSFEVSMHDFEKTFGALAELWQLGYRRFKLVNQARNPEVQLPQPPREGKYVEHRFDSSTSGPFGEETPGPWLDVQAMLTKYTDLVRQQSLRTAYEQSGRIYGIPVRRIHGLVKSVYNAPPVKLVRRAYSTVRRREMGGWFDLHARLGE